MQATNYWIPEGRVGSGPRGKLVNSADRNQIWENKKPRARDFGMGENELFQIVKPPTLGVVSYDTLPHGARTATDKFCHRSTPCMKRNTRKRLCPPAHSAESAQTERAHVYRLETAMMIPKHVCLMLGSRACCRCRVHATLGEQKERRNAYKACGWALSPHR